MRIASIDIGTNTVLLLIADIDASGVVLPIQSEQRIPRLGQGVDAKGMINPAAFDRVGWVLSEFRNLAIQHRCDIISACGTSALRDAINKQEFIDYINRTVGVVIEVLSGDEEALLTYRGALSRHQKALGEFAVVDIGGGSTEITLPGKDSRVGNLSLNRNSLQIGSVRVTEKFLKHHPPTSEEIAEARQFVRGQLEGLPSRDTSGINWIAVAGTATTLACLDQGLQDFDSGKVDAYVLSRDKVAFWFSELSRMAADEIRSLSNATEGRADILFAGVMILHEMIQAYDVASFQVSERGLRYGIVLREWEKALTPHHR